MLMLIDMAVVAIVPFLALLIRSEGNVNSRYYDLILSYLPEIVLVRLLSFYVFGLYRRLWRYASISELIAIVGAVTIGSAILWAYTAVTATGFPQSVHILSWLFNILVIGASRLGVRVINHIRHMRGDKTTKTLIVGAGDAGAMLAREIYHRYYDSKKLVGFVDDDEYKKDKLIFGVKVLGQRSDIPSIVKQYGVNEIIVAIPSVAGNQLREIIKSCKKTACTVKTLPGIYELIDGKVTVQQLRSVDIEDLLRRDPVQLDIAQIADYLTDKVVLVTGAGGSIGSELCRQIANLSPKRLVLVGRGENSIYEINRELRDKYSCLDIIPVIADVRDKDRINNVFIQHKPLVVFHAAAHKHVPLMEAQPVEAVQNNIFGTKNVAEAADRIGTKVMVLISTDKAVNPTSVMGATKRVAELIIQSMSRLSNTKFVAVRFGNVLGSRGSVVPLFKKQIAKGGPITITHPDMKRYFMTIPEASQLVLQAGSMAKGGEVFVLDMGEPVKIVDMANDLIELSGLKSGHDIEIKFSGLRPGEKLFEELLTAEEGTASTKHSKIYVANIKEADEQRLQQGLQLLEKQVYPEEIVRLLNTLVPTYKTTNVAYQSENKVLKPEPKQQKSLTDADFLTVSDAG